jgi:hypothetical protein
MIMYAPHQVLPWPIFMQRYKMLGALKRPGGPRTAPMASLGAVLYRILYMDFRVFLFHALL